MDPFKLKSGTGWFEATVKPTFQVPKDPNKDPLLTLEINPDSNPDISETFQSIEVYTFVKGIFQDAIAHAKVTPKYLPNNFVYVLNETREDKVGDKDSELVAALEK